MASDTPGERPGERRASYSLVRPSRASRRIASATSAPPPLQRLGLLPSSTRGTKGAARPRLQQHLQQAVPRLSNRSQHASSAWGSCSLAQKHPQPKMASSSSGVSSSGVGCCASHPESRSLPCASRSLHWVRCSCCSRCSVQPRRVRNQGSGAAGGRGGEGGGGGGGGGDGGSGLLLGGGDDDWGGGGGEAWWAPGSQMHGLRTPGVTCRYDSP